MSPQAFGKLSHQELLEVDKDYERTAEVAKLKYVRDSDPGIIRKRKGKGFSYIFKDTTIKEKDEIIRIRKLAIPPAWEKVWICKFYNGHIQATGFDLRKRKQYRYHSLWNVLRNETKFHRLYEFGKALPRLHQKMNRDIASKDLTQEKVLATILSLMEHTYIRIGNSGYEKLYGSYGLTTLKDKHVEISGDKMVFSFKGKKGIDHNITLKNKKLAKIVKACRDIPGKELFQYYDKEGNRCPIDSGMVNNYLKEATGEDFSAKDFRTWAGSLHALQALRSLNEPLTESERKRNIIWMLDQVSEKLGNTRTVCKKYYVHPGLVKIYEENRLTDFLNPPKEPDQTLSDFLEEETILMHILKNAR